MLTDFVFGQVADQVYKGIRVALTELGQQKAVAAARDGSDLARQLAAAHRDKVHLLPPPLRKALLAILGNPVNRGKIVDQTFMKIKTDPEFGVLATYETWLFDNLRRAANLLYVHLSRMEG